jgi:hypothetical protein
MRREHLRMQPLGPEPLEQLFPGRRRGGELSGDVPLEILGRDFGRSEVHPHDALHCTRGRQRSDLEGLFGRQEDRRIGVGDLQPYIARVEWLQTHCLVNAQTCKDNDGVPELPSKWWPIVGILAVVFIYNIVRWAMGGFPVPRYIHLFALGALGIVAVGILMVYRQHGEVGPRWPMVLAAGPGLIYLVAIGLGGSLWATRRRKEREAREAAANAAKPLDDRPKPSRTPPVMRR